MGYQDDLTLIVICRFLAELLKPLIIDAITIDLRVQMAEKEGATLLCAPTFESIGDGYILAGKQRHCRPPLETWQKFESGARTILARGSGRRRLTKIELLPIIGLLGHVAQFVRCGSVLEIGGNMLLRVQKGVPETFRLVDGDGGIVKALCGMLAKYARGGFKPLVRTAQAFHFGETECAHSAARSGRLHAAGWREG